MLHAAWEGGDPAMRKRAWQLGKQVLRSQGGEPAYQEANDAVARWVRDYASGRLGMYSDVLDASFLDQNRLQFRVAAAPAILDAILASLVGESLPVDESSELLGPWSTVIEGTPDADASAADTASHVEDDHP
jgi:hypothetical protein